MSIPIIFHVVDIDYEPGKSSKIFTEFFHFLDELPSAAKLVWHDFEYDGQIMEDFLSRFSNSFISICARKEGSFEYLKVFLYCFN